MSENQNISVSFITVDAEYAGQRIDNFLITRLKGVPKSVVYRILRKGEVRVNKGRVKPEYKLQAQDVIRVPPIRIEEKANTTVNTALKQVANLEASILFEDLELIVINKPSGMAVHGGSGLSYGVIEALRALRPEAQHLELVHRLDRDTSGCLIIAKKRSALRSMHEQLRDKVVQKHYHALVEGTWPAKLKNVTAPLRKNTLQSGERVVRVDEVEGKASHTQFKILQRYQGCTLVQAFPVTGRTHQIRVHTACSGHPIAGDDKYGNQAFDESLKSHGLSRLFLHAYSLQFKHPKTGELLSFVAPLDEKLTSLLANLSKV